MPIRNLANPILLALSLVIAAPAASWLPMSGLEAKVTALQKTMLSRDYAGAERQAAALEKEQGGVLPGRFYEAMVLLSKHDDLGDRGDLERVRAALQSPFPASAAPIGVDSTLWNLFWDGLRLYQLGYVKEEKGDRFAAALDIRAGVKRLERTPWKEAQAFVAVYGYYIDQLTSGLSWMLGDHRDEYISRIDSASRDSRWFAPLYSNILCWILWERGEGERSIQVAVRLQGLSPDHPVFAQVHADMLYRAGRVSEARDIYLKSEAEYARRAPGSVRYWCAVGNLVRICKTMGDVQGYTHWKDRLKDPAFAAIKSRMPKSLMEALRKAGDLP